MARSRRRSPRGEEAALYGQQPVSEALRAGRREIKSVLIGDTRSAENQTDAIQSLASSKGIAVERVDPQRLDRLCSGGNHQGVALMGGGYPYAGFNEICDVAGRGGTDPLILILDHIQDPQNLGALLRVAHCAGVDGVLIPSDRAAGVTPAASRASAGAAEHMRVAKVPNLVHCIRKLQEALLRVYGLEGSEDSEDYTSADLSGPLALVVGSEGRGLKRLVRETCDGLIRLPMFGKVDSLNASVAGGIALYEVVRQRQAGS